MLQVFRRNIIQGWSSFHFFFLTTVGGCPEAVLFCMVVFVVVIVHSRSLPTVDSRRPILFVLLIVYSRLIALYEYPGGKAYQNRRLTVLLKYVLGCSRGAFRSMKKVRRVPESA